MNCPGLIYNVDVLLGDTLSWQRFSLHLSDALSWQKCTFLLSDSFLNGNVVDPKMKLTPAVPVIVMNRRSMLNNVQFVLELCFVEHIKSAFYHSMQFRGQGIMRQVAMH